MAEALEILGFAEMRDGSLHLTPAGNIFVGGAAEARKKLFSEHLLRNVPLAAHIRLVLSEPPGHDMRAAPRFHPNSRTI